MAAGKLANEAQHENTSPYPPRQYRQPPLPLSKYHQQNTGSVRLCSDTKASNKASETGRGRRYTVKDSSKQKNQPEPEIILAITSTINQTQHLLQLTHTSGLDSSLRTLKLTTIQDSKPNQDPLLYRA
ncbi:hypothetical protein KC19_10G008700 [Ceratodon purpureus]|uniref:Uncharacterized protein n=1 Tax=Ceratodon purpureus TaxID=3225 RepID=A0A8T0GJ08_CERPU|nr:hypothetical protein KC19_10G008700 [Ceratodon purpureus]